MEKSGLTDGASAKEEEVDFFIMRKSNSSDISKVEDDTASEKVELEPEETTVNCGEKIMLKDDEPSSTSTQLSLPNSISLFETGGPAAQIAAAIQVFKAAGASSMNSDEGKNIAQNLPLVNPYFPIPAFTLSVPNNSTAMNLGNSDMKFLVVPVHQCWGCLKEFTDVDLFTEHVTKSMCLPKVDTKSSINEPPQLPSDTSASLSDQAAESSSSGPSTTQESSTHKVGKIKSRESSRNVSSIDSVIDEVLMKIREEIADNENGAGLGRKIELKSELEPMQIAIPQENVDSIPDNDSNNNKPNEGIMDLDTSDLKLEIATEEVTDLGDHLDIDPQHPARLKKAVYSCFECDQEFHTNIGLLRHQSIAHGAKQFPCEKAGCSKVFKNESALNDHRKRVHGPRSFACVHCNAYFTTETYLKAHIKIHLEKKHVCKQCDHSFVNKTDLNNHMRVHTGVKPYSCKVCGKAFRHVSGYYTHVRIHTGETPYQCEFCEKKFTNASNFQTHRKIHTQDKKFKCDVCGKEFIQQSNFTRHKRTHTKERPYKCTTCGEQFSYSTCLKKHLKKDHGVEPLECDRCKRTFLNYSSFVRHRTGCQFKDIVKKEAETDSAQFL